MPRTEPLSESAFSALRAAIALAWVDNELSSPEREALRHYLSHPRLTESQRTQLQRDIDQGGEKLDALLPHITELRDRAHLINMAQVLVARDGVVDAEEQQALNHMLARHLPTIDREKAQEEARIAREAFLAEQREAGHQQGVFSRLAEYIGFFLS